MDLVTECETSSSGNKHILTIIDPLTGWPEAVPIPDKSADTVVSTFINQYPPIHMCHRYILSDNGMEFKNQLMDKVLQQLGIKCVFSAPYHPWQRPQFTPTPASRTHAMILRRSRLWTAEL